MKNHQFQFLWFKFLSKFYPRKNGNSGTLEDYADYMLAYISWGNRLTSIQCAIIGDSNGEELKDYESMKRIVRPAVNFSIGGTRADSWVHFFEETKKGQEVYDKIKNLDFIIVNVGGNNILQNKFNVLDRSLKKIHTLLPQSIFITIPFIWSELVSKLSGKSKEVIDIEILEANAMIKQYDHIDVSIYTGKPGKPFWFVHKDAVHYSEEFDYKIRIPLINSRLL